MSTKRSSSSHGGASCSKKARTDEAPSSIFWSSKVVGNILVCNNTIFKWDYVSKVKIGSEAQEQYHWRTSSGRCTMDLPQLEIHIGELYTLDLTTTSYDNIPYFVKKCGEIVNHMYYVDPETHELYVCI